MAHYEDALSDTHLEIRKLRRQIQRTSLNIDLWSTASRPTMPVPPLPPPSQPSPESEIDFTIDVEVPPDSFPPKEPGTPHKGATFVQHQALAKAASENNGNRKAWKPNGNSELGKR